MTEEKAKRKSRWLEVGGPGAELAGKRILSQSSTAGLIAIGWV